MKIEGMLVTETLSKSIKRHVQISVVCLCLGFAGGYYCAGHKSDVDTSNYQIVYDSKYRKFFAPKEYMIPYENNVRSKNNIGKDSSVSDLFYDK